MIKHTPLTRSRILAGLFSLALLGLGSCALAKPSKPVDVRKLALQWDFPLHAPVSASPVVQGNQLWVAAENGNLYAFDWRAKRLQWLYHSEGAIASTPAVADGRVYFLSRDGFVNALDQYSGKLLWRFATGGEKRFAAVGGYGMPASAGPVPDPWDFYASSPLVVNGLVYVGSSDHHVYALKADSGELQWQFNAGAPVHSSPAYADGTIVIGTWGTRLYALDAQTGAERWHFTGGVDNDYFAMQGIVATPRIDQGKVYVGARDGFFYAFNLSDGAQLWKYDAAYSWILSSAAIDERHVYVGTSDTGLMLALDKHTGEEVYRTDTRLWTYASPLLVGSRYVFAATMAGELYAYNKHTGEQLWYYQTPEGRRDIHDIVDDQTGKLRGDKLYAPEMQIQAPVEYVKTLGAFIASPVWVDNQLIAVSATGNILLFGQRRP